MSSLLAYSLPAATGPILKHPVKRSSAAGKGPRTGVFRRRRFQSQSLKCRRVLLDKHGVDQAARIKFGP